MLRAFLGLSIHQPFVIELRNGILFKVRTPMDIWIIKETCLDHQYERASVRIQDGWKVVDLGAGLGDFTISVAKRHLRSQVYAYEPLPESFELLQENLLLNKIQNAKTFLYAVGAQTGSLYLRAVSAEGVQATTVPKSGRPQKDAIEVPSVTLDQVFAELKLSECDYLKVDCEGAEYEIFFHTQPSTLQKIKQICLEYHDGVTSFSHNDLVRFFECSGFRVKLVPKPVHRDLGLLYACNLNLRSSSIR